MAQRLTQAFPVCEETLWRALRVSLWRVTTQATFWENAHRVEWSSDATLSSWDQVFNLSVDPGANGSSILTLSGKSPVRRSFGDRGRRAASFRTLVDAVSETLARGLAMTDDIPAEDRVRYWNGAEWTVEPPPDPS